MRIQDLLLQWRIDSRKIADEHFRPGLSEVGLRGEAKARGFEALAKIDDRVFRAKRPIPGGGIMDARNPIPVTMTIRRKHDHMAAAAAGHSAQQAHLLIEMIVFDHARIENEIVFRLAGSESIAKNKTSRKTRFLENTPGRVQRGAGKVEQIDLESAALGQSETLPSRAAASFENASAAGQNPLNKLSELLAEFQCLKRRAGVNGCVIRGPFSFFGFDCVRLAGLFGHHTVERLPEYRPFMVLLPNRKNQTFTGSVTIKSRFAIPDTPPFPWTPIILMPI
ncbi:MAG TPA: hypothetical protein VKX39_12690 [Bryobacteraceae bacterium]|nr:hypothetical protein [Bryobacteraceae bacterium]